MNLLTYDNYYDDRYGYFIQIGELFFAEEIDQDITSIDNIANESTLYGCMKVTLSEK